MIVSDAFTISVLLALALALASVINYSHKCCSKLWRHSDVTYDCHYDASRVIIYDRNMLIQQALGANPTKLFTVAI
jgi:hypothetical protein